MKVTMLVNASGVYLELRENLPAVYEAKEHLILSGMQEAAAWAKAQGVVIKGILFEDVMSPLDFGLQA
jgi:hypothetical protein